MPRSIFLIPCHVVCRFRVLEQGHARRLGIAYHNLMYAVLRFRQFACRFSPADQVQRRTTLTRREIAKLACKLFALWFFCKAFEQVYTSIGLIIAYFALSRSSWDSPDKAAWTIFAITTIGYLLLGVILWAFSEKLASRMVSADTSPVMPKRLDARLLLSVAISVVGVYYAVESLVGIGRSIFVVLFGDEAFISFRHDLNWQGGLFARIATFVLSLWLIFGSRGLAAMIRRYRTAKSPSADQPQHPGD